MFHKRSIVKIVGTLCVFFGYANAEKISVHTTSGEYAQVHVYPGEDFCDILEKINCQLSYPSNGSDLIFESTYAPAKSATKVVRNYWTPATKHENEIVQHIIMTMGNKSLAKIWRERDSLKRNGDKLDNLHPFRFLLAIFTHEEAKAAMASLKGREWVWGEFKKGLYTSLTEEHEKRNLKDDHIEDFAKQLGIKSQLITPYIRECDWDGLVSSLIKNVPREGDPTRYNM